MNNTEINIPSQIPDQCNLTEAIANYSSILNEHEISFTEIDKYLYVGNINWTQGWILHVSVIRTQIIEMFNLILPILHRDNVPFKIPANELISMSILNGEHGYTKLGKIISIYPSNENQAQTLAKEIVSLTIEFRGPRILTDRYLGGALYTRYGAGNPVIQSNEKGELENFIYNTKGELLKDHYTIPFSLPHDIVWPFGFLTTPNIPKKETVLQDKYKPYSLLKEDAKGEVKKALWLEKIYRIKWCVIKEGKKDMNADLFARDMRDRLEWQYTLHNNLVGALPIPKVYDLFVENDDTYLVMQYIKGESLDNIILNHYSGKNWKTIELRVKNVLIEYSIQILSIIEKMHSLGYIHRDITSGNFLVDKDNKIWLIDLELAYSTNLSKPSPPFRLGTSGFMSFEQQQSLLPKESQDVYSLGALLIVLLTGLLPGKFSVNNNLLLRQQLTFFIPDEELITTVAKCFDNDPTTRPTIPTIKQILFQFKSRENDRYATTLPSAKKETFGSEYLEKTINKALLGLASPALMNEDSLWFSKTIQNDHLAYYQTDSNSIYPGFYEGLSGVIFLLARAAKANFSIILCQEGYTKSKSYIEKMYSNNLNINHSGFYAGKSGLAFSLTEEIDSGLAAKNHYNIEKLKLYFKDAKTEGWGIVKGIAGYGMALLKASSILNEAFTKPILDYQIGLLLDNQQKDGSWLNLVDGKNNSLKITGWGNGVAGIVCFLLQALKYYENDEPIIIAIEKALRWLSNQATKKRGQLIWFKDNKSKETFPDFQDGNAGIAFSFIKAYEAFNTPFYKKTAEDALLNYPTDYTSRNITLSYGLSGIGEIFIEAQNVFKSDKWKERSDWIAQNIAHQYIQQKDNSCYWMVDSTPSTTAGLMTGNCGVIHYLIRHLYPNNFSHPLMSL